MNYLHPQLDLPAARAALQQRRLVQVRNFFAPEVAEALHRALGSVEWGLSFRDDNGDALLTGSQLRSLGATDRERLNNGILSVAQQDFQFSFLSYSLVDSAQRGETDLLTRFTRWMADEQFLGAMRDLTGLPGLNRLYAQATLYAPGNFLMIHDDEVTREKRRVAYVINLTQGWRPDWGGLLHFCDESGDVLETFSPHFNSMSLFLVPQDHFVSFVAPFARTPRMAITGWLIEA